MSNIIQEYKDLQSILEENLGDTPVELIHTTNQAFKYKEHEKHPLKVTATSISFGTLRTSSIISISCKSSVIEVKTLNSTYTFRLPEGTEKHFYWEASKETQQALTSISLSTFMGV